MSELYVSDRIRIPLPEFQFSFSRSSGPGGQNVNKVNSKVTLRWQVGDSSALPADVRQRFIERFPNRINGAGELLIHSQRFREQDRNLSDCLDKLRVMLTEVATPPKKRHRTRPTRGSKERRLQAKSKHSSKKQQRRDLSDG